MHAAQKPGYVEQSAATAKVEKYVANGLKRRWDRPVFYPLVFSTFGRRNKGATELFQLLAQHAEDLQWGPKWRWWMTEVPKFNAFLVKGNFQKVKTVRAAAYREFDNRYRNQVIEG